MAFVFCAACGKAPPAVLDAGVKSPAVKDAGVAAPPIDEAACRALEDRAAVDALRAKQACLEGMARQLDALTRQRKVNDAAIVDATYACEKSHLARGVAVAGAPRIPDAKKRTPKAKGQAYAAEAREYATCLARVAGELETALAAGDAAQLDSVRAKADGCGPKGLGILSLLGGLAPTAAPPWPMGPLDLACFDTSAFEDAVGDAFSEGDVFGGGIGLEPRKPGQSGLGTRDMVLKSGGRNRAPAPKDKEAARKLEANRKLNAERKLEAERELEAVGTAPANNARIESALQALLCSRARRIRCCHEVSKAAGGPGEVFLDLSADGGIARVEVPAAPAFGACLDGTLNGTPLGVAPALGKARYVYRAPQPPAVAWPPR
jgi:hypothetical protein